MKVYVFFRGGHFHGDSGHVGTFDVPDSYVPPRIGDKVSVDHEKRTVTDIVHVFDTKGSPSIQILARND